MSPEPAPGPEPDVGRGAEKPVVQPSSPEVTAEAVRAAVLAVPGVAAMHTGTFGEVATYLPGRRIDGVRVRDSATEVHVVLLWGAPILQTADAIRATASAITATPVDVAIQDVVLPSNDAGVGQG